MDAVLVNYLPLVGADGEPCHQQIASLCINRPQTANAFSGDILEAISENLTAIAADPKVRVLLFQSIGRHFSAGADLNWMKESASKGHRHNLQEAHKLTAMFEQLSGMPMPTIAVVKGAAYGGAVGIIACCDYAVATEDARLCLSEARVGLLPAVILPYLARKIHRGALNRLVLSAKVFSALDAKENGLVQKVLPSTGMNAWLEKEVNQLLCASPEAQKAYKNLETKIFERSCRQDPATAETIAHIRASDMGQEGLNSFFEKRKPNWLSQLPQGSQLFEGP